MIRNFSFSVFVNQGYRHAPKGVLEGLFFPVIIPRELRKNAGFRQLSETGVCIHLLQMLN